MYSISCGNSNPLGLPLTLSVTVGHYFSIYYTMSSYIQYMHTGSSYPYKTNQMYKRVDLSHKLLSCNGIA